MLNYIHLSDFHVGKDCFGQVLNFEYLISFIRNRIKNSDVPDLIFITGDIANAANEDEYMIFYESFLCPLEELLKDHFDENRIFIVPGNHDVNCNNAIAVKRHDVLYDIPNFLDPDPIGRKNRELLLSRFENYCNNDAVFTNNHWILSDNGFFSLKMRLHGYDVGLCGLNSAWLSDKDSDDREKLTFGKAMLERGLSSLDGCDILFVLSHHPIEWIAPSERNAIRALLGRYQVVFLCGHHHEHESVIVDGFGYPYISIQSGAAFIDRENEEFHNCFYLGNANLSTKDIFLTPYCWSKKNQEWVVNSTCLPSNYRIRGTDQWKLSIPQNNLLQDDALKLPEGWLIINKRYLIERQLPIDEKRALNFFDGSTPRWSDALSDAVPKRDIVNNIVEHFINAKNQRENIIVILLGAGGEGKSIALMQSICELVLSHEFRVLWHDNLDSNFSSNCIKSLPKDNDKTWLIASDAADSIAERLFNEIKLLRNKDRKDICYLICCRDTDWLNSKGPHLDWDKYINRSQERLKGLSRNDALKIVKAWHAFGNTALKELSKMTIEQATDILYNAARAELEQHPQDGAFLAAMLHVRYADGLKEHVYSLLKRLQSVSIKGGTLLNAFTYISAMHAEGLQILSKKVLANTLGCNEGDVIRSVIGPLGDESAGTVAGGAILTRHRTIAKVAVEILTSRFYIDIDNVFDTLVRSAVSLTVGYEYVPNANSWRYLSDHFFKKGLYETAIRLAITAYNEDSSSINLLVKVGHLFREAGQPEQSIKWFRRPHSKLYDSRSYCVEWATSEGNVQNHAFAVYLYAISLSDEIAHQRPNNEDTIYALGGVATALHHLFIKYQNDIFKDGYQAALRLYSLLNLSSTNLTHLERILRMQNYSLPQSVNISDCITQLHEVLEEARKYIEVKLDEIPQLANRAKKIEFMGLEQLLTLTTQKKQDKTERI